MYFASVFSQVYFPSVFPKCISQVYFASVFSKVVPAYNVSSISLKLCKFILPTLKVNFSKDEAVMLLCDSPEGLLAMTNGDLSPF